MIVATALRSLLLSYLRLVFVNMVLTTLEKTFIVEHYFRSYGNGRAGGPSLSHTALRFQEHFHKNPPSNAVILSVVEKFRRTGSVLTQRKGFSGRPVTVCTNENHGRVLQQVLQSPKRSLMRASLKLNISNTSMRRMFKNIGGFPYRIQTGQPLNRINKLARVQYCASMLAICYEEPDFLSDVWFTDECHVHLNGYINKQTTRFLGFERPDIVVERPQHSKRVTIWCAVSGRGIVGPYFFEGNNGETVTVNRYRYRAILDRFVSDLRRFCRARNLPLGSQWFQQDGATSHTAVNNIAFLRQTFGNRLISLRTNFPYPAHSPDLTTPDAYVWGMLKENIFREDPPSTIVQLKEKITMCIRRMEQPLFIKMVQNLQERYECCLKLNGAHIEHVITRV